MEPPTEPPPDLVSTAPADEKTTGPLTQAARPGFFSDFWPAVRKVLHTAALFVIIFLFVRTFAVEPFGVPTGSMAPAFIGNHRQADCQRCGYPVVVGDPGPERPTETTCPNCGQRHVSVAESREIPGDRLLVDKNVFHLRKPRRWEPAVFRCPVDDSKPYVKRVIGLPGEKVQLVDGDVWADGVLQRKTLAQLREVRLPVFDMNYTPPGGWGVRWLVEPVADHPNLPAVEKDQGKPADATVCRDGCLYLDASGDRPPVGLTYRHYLLDGLGEDAVRDGLPYNGPHRRSTQRPVHDFVFACEVEVVAGGGSFAVRLGDGLDTVKAELPIGTGGPAGIEVGRDGGDPPNRSPRRLEVGQTYRLEFAFADRRASLALDGKEVVPPLDLPADPDAIARRGSVSRPVQLGVRGASVVLRRVRIDRDTHYRSDGPHGTATPFPLGPSDYFMLGDNSGNSHDSREWAVPGVPEKDFIGKPFLIHQPLALGRVTVNGRERVYQTVDWSRLRWVR